MNTCLTCSYWSQWTHTDDGNGHGDCKNKKLLDCNDDDGLCSNSTDEYSFSTGMNFGCIHHKAHEYN